MARKRELRMKLPCIGQVDTEAYAVPPSAFRTVRGFEVGLRGYPFTEKALATYTTSEIRTSKRVRALKYWTDPDANANRYAMVDGGLWKVSAPGTFTLLSTIDPGGTVSRSSLTLTFSNIPNGTLRGVVRVGDEFYYDADGIDAGGTVSAVAETTLTLDAYAGGATSGNFTIWRRMADVDSWLAPAGGRLFVSDGTGPLYEYGPQSDGSATYAFRQTGVPVPVLQPTLVAGTGGSLSAGDYSYRISFESLRLEVGNPVHTRNITAIDTQKVTMTNMPVAPESPRASRYRIYRTKAGKTTGWFHLTKDITDKVTGIASQVITVAFGGLTISAHIFRRIKFITTGNSYEITANAAGDVTVTGDITGESTTDDVLIYGGYKISTIQSASATFIDYSSDAELDLDNEAPTDNDVPPSALKNLVTFQGGGRLGGTVGSLFYCSGRSLNTAAKQGFSDLRVHGLGEFGYWVSEPLAYEVGQKTGVNVKALFELGNNLYAVTTTDVWWFRASSSDMIDYQWLPAAQDIGCVEGKTLAVLSDAAYWLGTRGQRLDIIRFDGQFGRGMLRGRNRATLLSIFNYTEATAAAWQGRYYLSYDSDNGGTNDRTLRLDLDTAALEEQAWGCGVFMNPFMSGESRLLYCGASTNLGHIYRVEGSAQNLGSDTTRILETGDMHFGDPEHPPKWTELALTIIVEA